VSASHDRPPVLSSRRDRLFLLLGAFFIGNALLAELIGGKLFQVATPWHTFTLSCGILLWPIVFVVSDLVNEYFGRAGVKRLSFLAAGVIAYAFFALLVTERVRAVDFSPVDVASFRRVFLQSQWIIVGSIAAFLIAQLIDVSVFWFVRRRTGHRYLWARATGSTLISQFVDTIVVQYIGLHVPYLLGEGGISFANFVNSASSGYLFKLLVAIGVTPILYLVHWMIDRYLGKDAPAIIEAVAEREHAGDRDIGVPPA
jgi:uncharacterized integral membrane protein (TIGR00697 family)